MANKWFNEVFLKSLFDRWQNTKKGFWMSQKQTAICVDNMEVTTVLIPCDAVSNYKHNNYTCIFKNDEKTYNCIVSYSKKNGCGYIDFFYQMTEEEKAQYKLEKELEHYKLKITRRGCFDSEKYNKYMAELKQTLADCEEDLQEDIEEGWTDCIEEDKQSIEYYKNVIRIVEELKSNLE